MNPDLEVEMESALGHLTVALDIEGMSCASCVAHVEKALGAVDGVESVSVDLASRSAIVTLVPEAAAPTERLGAAVERAGYGVIAAE
ncbi:MAG TPA: heavy metal-associated domain-containing protein, partial [Myxococcota bacterium]|nr:heavy metal-associated domain-containing protein [Myxococcota bacterium]